MWRWFFITFLSTFYSQKGIYLFIVFMLLLNQKRCPKIQRFQICASPITGLSLLPTSQIAATSGSSELVIISIDQLCENVCNAKITPAKPIIFSKDDRIISIASSANEPIIALGMINGVCLIKLPYSIQSRQLKDSCSQLL